MYSPWNPTSPGYCSTGLVPNLPDRLPACPYGGRGPSYKLVTGTYSPPAGRGAGVTSRPGHTASTGPFCGTFLPCASGANIVGAVYDSATGRNYVATTQHVPCITTTVPLPPQVRLIRGNSCFLAPH